MNANKVLITTIPFGEVDPLPIERLSNEGLDYVINPLGRKPNEKELANMLEGFDMVIAGTEKYTDFVIDKAEKLKFISRVGIGLDGINFSLLEKKNIKVSYTPDAPTPAVAELSIASMLSLIRHLHKSNNNMHNKQWIKIPGRSLRDSTIGIIGLGPIGQEVLRIILSFNCKEILLNDIYEDPKIIINKNIKWTSKETIFKNADIITIHVPLTKNTKNMIDRSVLMQMKPESILVNNSRGGIINEQDLYGVLISGHLGGVAIDVFEQEPYVGELTEIDRCLLTPHIGTMTTDCRSMMEIQAVEEVIRFFKDEDLKRAITL